MDRAFKSGLTAEPGREGDKDDREAAAAVRRQAHAQTLATTLQRISPAVRDCVIEFFRGMHLSTTDFTGNEQVAAFKEEMGATQHTWKAWSWKKTGTHTEYRSDGAHSLDEHTAYAMTISLFVNQDNLPLLHVGEFTTSKLVAKMPVIASSFSMDVPARFKDVLREKTGIRVADTTEYVQAQDH